MTDILHITIKIDTSLFIGLPLRIQIYKVQDSYILEHKGDIDQEKFTLPGDEVERRFQISKDEYDRLLNGIDNMSLNAVPECVMGLDGTTYELIFDNGLNTAHYRWWQDPPKGWEELKKIY